MRVEVRPGDGGEDAELFADELTGALAAYASRRGWATTIDRPVGSRTTTVHITGSGCGSDPMLRRLPGVHRIQRIPRNDARGRRHTSTAILAVLDDGATAGSRDLDLSQVRIDTFRGTGPGGQHRNKTDSAVRATHLPTGLTVTVTRGRSQHQNKAAAVAELTQRLSDLAAGAQAAHVDQARAEQVAAGTGRGGSHLAREGVQQAKMFTYNTQRSQVVDHVTGQRWPLESFMRGRFDRTISA